MWSTIEKVVAVATAIVLLILFFLYAFNEFMPAAR